MRVSVITIFKNEERFLNEAVDSVLRQTYQDWECLLVDDGSVDDSTAIAQRLARQHSNVHYLKHPNHANRGMGRSRNLALAAARGDLIALLDGDDLWEPEKLSQQITLFDLEPGLAMIFGAPLYWYSWTGQLNDLTRDHLQRLDVSPGDVFESPELVNQFLRNSDATPCTCDFMVRRSIALAVGGWVNEFHGLYEDQVFCIKVALSGRVLVGPSGLSRYRIRSDSVCAREFQAGRHATARRHFLKWVKRYLRENGQNHNLKHTVSEELKQVRKEICRKQRLRLSRLVGWVGTIR